MKPQTTIKWMTAIQGWVFIGLFTSLASPAGAQLGPVQDLDRISPRDAYCMENPDDPKCLGRKRFLETRLSPRETYCMENPDDSKCLGRARYLETRLSPRDTYCMENPDDPKCLGRARLLETRLSPLDLRDCEKNPELAKCRELNLASLSDGQAPVSRDHRALVAFVDQLKRSGYKKVAHEIQRLLLVEDVSAIQHALIKDLSLHPSTAKKAALLIHRVGRELKTGTVADTAPARVIRASATSVAQ